MVKIEYQKQHERMNSVIGSELLYGQDLGCETSKMGELLKVRAK